MTTQFNPKTGSRGIEWCDRTENVFGGCFHRCRWQMPDGTVAVCYAEQLAEHGTARAGYPNGFEHHYWRPKNLRSLVAGKEPNLIFIDSMSDVMGHWIPEEQVYQMLEAMAAAPHHVFQMLTKAPARLLKFMDAFPPNLWVGVSSPPDWMMGKRLTLAQQQRMLARTLEVLAQVAERVPVVWMSIEPLSWDIAPYMEGHPLKWAVIGAAMNDRKKFQPDPEHVHRLLEVFDASWTPVFYKGNISATFRDYDFGDPNLQRWREDFPLVNGQMPPAVARRQELCAVHGWTPSTFLPEVEQATVLPSGQLALF